MAWLPSRFPFPFRGGVDSPVARVQTTRQATANHEGHEEIEVDASHERQDRLQVPFNNFVLFMVTILSVSLSSILVQELFCSS
jgi:hypothetical protein